MAAVLHTNVIGTVLVTQSLLPLMRSGSSHVEQSPVISRSHVDHETSLATPITPLMTLDCYYGVRS